mmetsp:Transcript_23616/g.46502  ORF Transcript_23616/g.46502 Transcript_23616/m.46502 type:complete len:203 (-) Transcript_23616:444-1052(-)
MSLTCSQPVRSGTLPAAWASSSARQWAWPYLAAVCRGVPPSWSRQDTLPPLSSAHCSTLLHPNSAATCTGVSPNLSGAFTLSNPATEERRAAHSTRSCTATMCRGVRLSSSVSLTSTFRSTSSCTNCRMAAGSTAGTAPLRRHRWSRGAPSHRLLMLAPASRSKRAQLRCWLRIARWIGVQSSKSRLSRSNSAERTSTSSSS